MALLFPRIAYTPVRCTPLLHHASTPSPLLALFDETLAHLERASRHPAPTQQQPRRPFNPRFDVQEAAASYLVEGELPGFDAKDISIEFLDDGHTLQIQGRHETVVSRDQREPSAAVEGAVTKTPAVTEQDVAAPAKTLQPTVEDEVEGEQAHVKAVSAESTTSQQQQQQQQQQAQAVTQQQQTAAPQVQPPRQWISERHVGSFSRSFNFPARVNQDAVKASLKDGILAITLPFAKKPESRRIQIE